MVLLPEQTSASGAADGGIWKDEAMGDLTQPCHVLLASNRLFRNAGDPYIYPYEISIDFRETPPAIWVAEGDAHSAMGAKLSAEEMLAPTWESFFAQAAGAWLRPRVESLANGESVTQAELVALFQKIHGRDPQILR